MGKNLAEKVEETQVFRHNGKLLFLMEGNAETLSGNKSYAVRDGAGRILGAGDLPLEFYHENTLLSFAMGPGHDFSPEGKLIDVQVPRLYRIVEGRQRKDVV